MEKTKTLAGREEASLLHPQPVVSFLRGDQVESVHFGHVAVVDARGGLLASAGDPSVPVFPRSSFKPFQALPLVESGVFARSELEPEALALIAGSHGGTDRQAALALSILMLAGLDASALGCGAHEPYDEPTALAMRRRNERPTALRNNCSGKHAGMLLLAKAMGAPVESYLDPDHPVQRRIFQRFEELMGRRFGGPPAIDGCSAPTPRMPLTTLAHSFALLALGTDAAGKSVPALAQIRDAMTAYPANVASEGRLDTVLMRRMKGVVVSKAGAEGVHAIGHVKRGIGIAVKIQDGARRALKPAVVSVLSELGLLSPEDLDAIQPMDELILRNHTGLLVGEIRSALRLKRAGR